MADKLHKIAIIGSGKVATALGHWLFNAGIEITGIWSRNLQNAKKLAAELDSKVIADLSAVDSSNDLIIIAVNDDAIQSVSEQLQVSQSIVVHTSGARPLSDLQNHAQCGVFYPLQTFSGNTPPDFSKIPFCIEANSASVFQKLESFCKQLSANSYSINSNQRSVLHVAAVIANNFTNHLWGKSRELLEKAAIDPKILHPLMQETLQKAMNANPFDIQTGPAARNDSDTIHQHLQLISNDVLLSEIYRLISQSIQNHKS